MLGWSRWGRGLPSCWWTADPCVPQWLAVHSWDAVLGRVVPSRAILTASWTAVSPVSLLPFIPPSSSSCARKHPPWELLSVRSLGSVNLTSSPSSEVDSLARWRARVEMAPYTSQLCDKKGSRLLWWWLLSEEEKPQRTQTFDDFRHKVCRPLGLLYPIALHDLTISVDTDIPGAARLGLTIEHGWVRDIVVLKHALFELTLRGEVLLQEKRKQKMFFNLPKIHQKQHKDAYNIRDITLTYLLNVTL